MDDRRLVKYSKCTTVIGSTPILQDAFARPGSLNSIIRRQNFPEQAPFVHLLLLKRG